VLALVPLGVLALGLPMFAESSRASAEVGPLFDRVPPRSAVALLELTPQQPWRPFSTGSQSYRVLAARGGRISYSFTDSPVSAALLEPAFRWNDYVARCADRPLSFRPGHDLTRFAFVLAHVEDAELGRALVRAFTPEATLLETSGGWMLFASTLPTVPLESPDAAPPAPAPPTLRRKLLDVGAKALVSRLEPGGLGR
jgi:hypothetical protein